MLLFPFISNGSFPVQNYESQTISVKNDNEMINYLKTEKSDGSFPFGFSSLLIGVLSIPLLFVLPVLGALFSVLAIVFGSIGLKSKGRVMAIAGICLGSLALLIGIFFIIYAMAVMISILNALN
ncbi:hypothetical protein OA863_02270 [Bacteroidota bacterium]|nr:hypothetical protein [Bacteroidota bacterium]MDC3230428.1 hypothetical protein [Bacteroidota bacterium]